MNRVLVTGGAGFLGSHLCERLLQDGNDVICVDNLYTGSKDNIRHLMANPYFEFIRHDVTEPLYVEVDQIYNLACPASPVHYQANPVKTTKTSVYGALNTLGLAKRVGARILQASTSEVYGDPEIHPQPETYRGCVNPIGVRSCYDEGKRVAETLFFDYHRMHNLEIKIMRIFNTYGPRMNSQTRSFCYVDDLIEGMVRLMASPADFTGPCNLGNPGEFTILQLAEKTIALTGSKSRIVYRPLPSDDPMQRKPVIDLAKEHLDWEPHIALDEGLKKTIDYFKRVI